MCLCGRALVADPGATRIAEDWAAENPIIGEPCAFRDHALVAEEMNLRPQW